MDWLKFLAIGLIMIYHFFVEMTRAGKITSSMDLTAGSVEMIIMTTVSLFFMAPAAGLSYSADRKKKIDWKSWYKSHLFKLLFPYYLVYLITVIGFIVLTHSYDYFDGVPAWHFIYTLMGIDGYLKMLGIPTFFMAAGEWFLGCLVAMYICFPLMYYAIKKAGDQVMIVLTVIYLIVSFTYRWQVPAHQNLILKMFDFITGIYIIQKTGALKKWMVVPSALILVIVFSAGDSLPLSLNLKSYLAALTIYIIAYHLEYLLAKLEAGKYVSIFVSKYSYEVFLLHHAVIFAFAVLFPALNTPWKIMIGLLTVFLCIFISTLIVKQMEKIISGAFGKMHRAAEHG